MILAAFIAGVVCGVFIASLGCVLMVAWLFRDWDQPHNGS